MGKSKFRGMPGSGRTKGSMLSATARESFTNTLLKNRADAEELAEKILFCILNEEYGFGLERLTKIGERFQKELQTYYDDTAVGEAHIREYLAKVGFLMIDGQIYTCRTKDGKIIRGNDAKDAVAGEIKRKDPHGKHEIIGLSR